MARSPIQPKKQGSKERGRGGGWKRVGGEEDVDKI